MWKGSYCTRHSEGAVLWSANSHGPFAVTPSNPIPLGTDHEGGLCFLPYMLSRRVRYLKDTPRTCQGLFPNGRIRLLSVNVHSRRSRVFRACILSVSNALRQAFLYWIISQHLCTKTLHLWPTTRSSGLTSVYQYRREVTTPIPNSFSQPQMKHGR